MKPYFVVTATISGIALGFILVSLYSPEVIRKADIDTAETLCLENSGLKSIEVNLRTLDVRCNNGALFVLRKNYRSGHEN